MNTFWLKIAGVVVLVVGIIVAVSVFSPSKSQQEPQSRGPQTYAEQVAEDRAKFEIDHRTQQLSEPKTEKLTPAEKLGVTHQPLQVTNQKQPVERQFRELDLANQVQAERLLQMAQTERSMGRLPGTGRYGRMVKYCRQIIQSYPGTVYAYQAKRMLADISEDYRSRYSITDEEIDFDD